ncbi:hypothetical protein D910_03964 [Dendroctonus ponderosae]|uniref:Uncharacterized protein n=1 Tax=Dendroctonus ponderosae TaxID=77166 RepID=U4U0E9_DENPD|nr:hypothetical protein D910_03964 [Dendroctonus ponderosae]
MSTKNQFKALSMAKAALPIAQPCKDSLNKVKRDSAAATQSQRACTMGTSTRPSCCSARTRCACTVSRASLPPRRATLAPSAARSAAN